MNENNVTLGFADLGLSVGLLEILKRLNFNEPTPIQRQAIPIVLTGKDLVGIAQTGTGKTLAFGLPMVERLRTSPGMGLIVLPTRELAFQVDEALKQVGGGLKTALLIGGTGLGSQVRAIENKPKIIIATPGRLNDFIQQRLVNLSRVSIVVLDEADRMLDMGFAPQIKKIFDLLPKVRQTLLFSATMPPAIMRMATTYLKLPIRVEVAPSGTPVEQVTQEIFILPKDLKLRFIEKLLIQYAGPTLVFTRTKYGAKRLNRAIREMGHKAAELHSNRTLSQRREALDGFKAGRYRVLIATDIASRGIDVTGIELVLNYDLPTNSEDYVHRIGRTARAGAGGHAISFVMPEQRQDVRDIERLIKQTLRVSPVPAELPPARRTAPSIAGWPGRKETPNFGTGRSNFRPTAGHWRQGGGRR